MKRPYRKQTRNDFMSRLDRLDPAYVRGPTTKVKSWEVDKTATGGTASIGGGPIKLWIKGFCLALTTLFVAANPGKVQRIIAETGVPYELRFAALALVAAALTSAFVLFANHTARACFRKLPQSDRSMALAVGALLGVMAFQLPQDVWQTGYDYVEERSSSVYYAALSGNTGIAPIDWGSSILVSSLPK